MTMTTSYTSLATISAATNGINDLAFSSDGTLLASASDDKYLRVFDIQRKISMVWHFRGEAEFTAVTWIGKDLFAGTMNGELLLFPRVVVSCTLVVESIVLKENAELVETQATNNLRILFTCGKH